MADQKNNQKSLLITGGSSGIGKSIAELFAQENWKVATIDKQKASFSDYIKFFQGDLTKKTTVDTLYAQLTKADFYPDLLVLNAGKGIHQSLAEGDPDQWEEVIQLNLMSTLRMIRAFLPDMIERGRGDVVFITSVSARHPYPYGGVYAATKAALEVVAETLRLEQQPHIRVIRILPGVVDTDFFENNIDGEQNPETIGWGALDPDEVAQVVLHAVSQEHQVALNEIVLRPVAQPM